MPTYTPEMDAELAKEMEARVAAAKAADAASAAPVSTDKAPSNAAATPDKVEDASGAAPVSKGTEGETDKGATPPGSTPALDLSFLPEAIRSKVTFADEESVAFLKNAIDGGRAEATKRFQEASAVKRDADNYRALVADPEVAKVIVKAVADKQAGRPVSAPEQPEDEPEIDLLDPKTIDARIASRVRKEREAILAEINRPNVLKQAVNDALTSFAVENSIDQAVMVEAVKMADGSLAQRGKRWDPSTVDVLMPAYVELAKAKIAKAASPAPMNKAPAASAVPGTETVASPVGRGGPHQAHIVPLPQHFANGRSPSRRLTDDELEQEGLYAMRKRYGPDVTLEDYRAAART